MPLWYSAKNWEGHGHPGHPPTTVPALQSEDFENGSISEALVYKHALLVHNIFSLLKHMFMIALYRNERQIEISRCLLEDLDNKQAKILVVQPF